MTTHPPRLAIWLLTRRLSAEWRDFVVGDLEEEFATRSVDSPLAAHAWFWWQTLRCLAAPPPVRTHPFLNEKSQGDSMMRTLFADLRYAFRAMFRTPSFAVAVVSVLALGIGGNTAVFSVVDQLLLRPLPYPDGDQLVIVEESSGLNSDASRGDRWPTYCGRAARRLVMRPVCDRRSSSFKSR
jgi:hypothetical protein